MAKQRKARKDLTLSAESLAFREEMRAKNSAGSSGAILEGILQSIRSEGKRSGIERELTQYYDSLTDATVGEERQWADLARRALVAGEHS